MRRARAAVGGGHATAGRERASARRQAGGRLLALLRLLAGRRRAPGGAHDEDDAGGAGQFAAGVTAGRQAEPVVPFPPGVPPESVHPCGGGAGRCDDQVGPAFDGGDVDLLGDSRAGTVPSKSASTARSSVSKRWPTTRE